MGVALLGLVAQRLWTLGLRDTSDRVRASSAAVS